MLTDRGPVGRDRLYSFLTRLRIFRKLRVLQGQIASPAYQRFRFPVFQLFGVLTPPKEKPRVKPRVQVAGATKAAPRFSRFENPFTRKNYIAFAVGLGFLLIGYICLAQPPANGFLSLTLAPILLVIGYCVVFPYAILAREKPEQAPKPTANS